MSADNWTECPGCVEKDKARYEREKGKVENAYGNVPSLEYLAMVGVVKSFEPKGNENLREDYEIGILRGKFYVVYKAQCDRCGFRYSFEFDELIQIKREES